MPLLTGVLSRLGTRHSAQLYNVRVAVCPNAYGRVAIVIERASAARSATVRLEAFGATAREREVAMLLARGLSRVEIAETLVLSPHTVEDHTKSLYDKVGVASRQELVAQVFVDEYLPEVAQSTPLTSRGRFDRV
jgi:DNA-binding CsgD family transcriptional regulator